MQQPRRFYRFHRNWLLYPLALAALFLASACAPGSASTLSGVGCADPSCNEVLPETRKVLGCIGETCNEPPAPSEAKKVPHAATETDSSASQPPAVSEADSGAPAAGEPDEDASSMWDLEVYYESHERP